MNNLDHKRQQLLLEIMTEHGAKTSTESTDELLRPWRQLAAQLSPLVGESGFCALYLRAIRLAAARFDWPTTTQSCKSVERALDALRDAYGSVAPDAARAGNAALLNTFTKLLADLIGEALTVRLLDSASNGADEQKQEHK